MKDYYKFISSTPYDSTEEIKKAIDKKKREISKLKIQKDHKKKIEKEIKETEYILLDYHRRREYDRYFEMSFFHPHMINYKIQQNPFFEEETHIPYLENNEETTPNHFFHNELFPVRNKNIFESIQNNIVKSQTSSYVQSGKDGTIVYHKNYQNIDGKEEEKEEKFFIDPYGNRKNLLL